VKNYEKLSQSRVNLQILPAGFFVFLETLESVAYSGELQS